MKILIADDHPLTLQGTKSFLESHGYLICSTCSNGNAALSQIHVHQPEIAILDINMPGLDGIEVARRIQESRMQTRVVLLTMHNESVLYKKALEYGVYGYILKEYALSEIRKCLEQVGRGEVYTSPSLIGDLTSSKQGRSENLDLLSFSERKIVELIAQQKTTRQIAELLFLSEKTVEGYRTSIIEKLGLPKEKNVLLKWALLQNFATKEKPD